MTREDIMAYSAMIAGFGTIFAGILADMGATHTAWACGIVALISLGVLCMAYLHGQATTSSSTHEHPQDYP